MLLLTANDTKWYSYTLNVEFKDNLIKNGIWWGIKT